MAIPAFFKIASEVSKYKSIAEGDISAIASLGKKFDPDKGLEFKYTGLDKDYYPKVDSDKLRMEDGAMKNQDKNLDNEKKDTTEFFEQKEISSNEIAEGEFFTSLEDRLTQARKSEGTWSGEPGQSDFIPSDEKAKAAIENKGEKSISYDSNGEPNFHPVSEGTVKINNMTENRYTYYDSNGNRHAGNYEQADVKLAEQWNNNAKDGRTDWTSRDVSSWVSENGLTRHECLDKQTVEYVDFSINDQCKHFGGCAECKARDNSNVGGKFDA